MAGYLGVIIPTFSQLRSSNHFERYWASPRLIAILLLARLYLYINFYVAFLCSLYMSLLAALKCRSVLAIKELHVELLLLILDIWWFRR